MTLKKLLVAFTTNRNSGGQSRRVRFDAGKVVDLTDAEIDILDRLTKSTGKLHYRAPINEGGHTAAAVEDEVVSVPDFEGQDVAMEDKTVAQLKSYLTFHGVEHDDKANKATLLEQAIAQESGDPSAQDPAPGDADNGL